MSVGHALVELRSSIGKQSQPLVYFGIVEYALTLSYHEGRNFEGRVWINTELTYFMILFMRDYLCKAREPECKAGHWYVCQPRA